MGRIYLDHLAGTPLLPEVFEAMRPFLLEHVGSPSALHQGGLIVREAMDRARQQVAAMIHAEAADEIIFTSGGTESANLAVLGAALAGRRNGRHIVATAIEHPAVENTLAALESQGFEVTRLPVDGEGMADPARLKAALTGQTILAATHLANHDIGTVQPVAEMGALCQAAGVPLFVDASHGAGWLPVDVQALGASLLSLSPHRFYGPKGVGVLYQRRGVRVQSILHGGGQEGGRRPGTEHVPGIVGAGRAAELAARDLPARAAGASHFQRVLLEGLKARLDGWRLNGPPPGPRRLCANLNVSLEGVEAESVVLRSDLKGVAFSSGTLCASKAVKVSPVLRAIGVDGALARGSILLSPGFQHGEEEIRAAAGIIAGVVEQLRAI